MIHDQTMAETIDIQGLDSLLPAERVQALKRTGEGPHVFVTARVRGYAGSRVDV
ncbi:MAG: hypothetical protein HY704_04465 [Gemmatimonadetes bacterium]|nr:hypothetical protein [Gemmatimonadota bacterium]